MDEALKHPLKYNYFTFGRCFFQLELTTVTRLSLLLMCPLHCMFVLDEVVDLVQVYSPYNVISGTTQKVCYIESYVM